MSIGIQAPVATSEPKNGELHIRDLSPGGFAEPYLGWSTFSLQAFSGKGPNGQTYGKPFMDETNIRKQAEVLASQPFREAGYKYINLDSGWSAEVSDEYGRYIPETTRFPTFHQMVSDFASLGLKVGIYLIPGIFGSDRNDPSKKVKGTSYTLADISFGKDANAFQGSRCKLNYDHPGAYLWVKSMVELLHEWHISFIKFDGLLPGSSVTSPWTTTEKDVAAFRKAIDEVFSPWPNAERIWLTGSWQLPTDSEWLPFWNRNLDAFRVCQDIESYSTITTSFPNVRRSIRKLWEAVTNANQQNFGTPENPMRTYWDLDSLLVGVGSMSQLDEEQRKTYFAIWAIAGGPLYIGDDLTKLDSLGHELLTNTKILQYRQKLGPVNYTSGIFGTSAFTGVHVWIAHHLEDKSSLLAITNVGTTSGALAIARPAYVSLAKLGLEVALDDSNGSKPFFYAVVNMWTGRIIAVARSSLIFWLPAYRTKFVKVVPIFDKNFKFVKGAEFVQDSKAQ